MKQQKIQVALCITELEIGGAEKMLVELASKLDLERFHPVIYSLRPEDFHQKESFIPFIRQENLELRFLDIRTSRDLWRGLIRFQRMLKEQKADILQCFMFHANLIGRFAGKLAGVPLICSGIRVAERDKKWHLKLDSWSQFLVDQYICVSQTVAEFTKSEGKIKASKVVSISNGISISNEKSGLNEIKTSNKKSTLGEKSMLDKNLLFEEDSIRIENPQEKSTAFLNSIGNAVLNGEKNKISNQNEIRIFEKKKQTSETRRTNKVNNLNKIAKEVSLEEISNSRASDKNVCLLKPLFFGGTSERNIVFVGRLTRQKGLDWLLETTPFWLKPSNNWHFWMIGDGEERLRLEEQVESLLMSSQVHFAGWRSDISAILEQADLFVLPSRWEGMPNVLLEAMAHQLPVLATQAEGVLEILGSDLTTVQTVSFGQTKDFIQKVQLLMNDESLRRELGRKNRNRILEQFSIQKMVERYENHWIKFLESR